MGVTMIGWDPSFLTEQTKWGKQMAEMRGLFVVPTPIGHQEDISLRALTTLHMVDGLLCEDTRQTAKILQAYGIKKPCYSYHQHNENYKSEIVLEHLKQGKRLALVSDRGTPGIADAGLLLISACYAHKIPVCVLPGPCAVITAFLLAGFLETHFVFQGFLPRQRKQQVKRLTSLRLVKGCLIFFESPERIAKALLILKEVLGDHPACVIREMTKKFETTERGMLSELYENRIQQKSLGEHVIVVWNRQESSEEQEKERNFVEDDEGSRFRGQTSYDKDACLGSPTS